MIMMFGDAAAMGEVRSPEWIREMIGEMIAIDRDLEAAGEMVFNAGLADGSTARTMRYTGGGPVAVTDGPFAESKEFLAGYYLVECASQERAYEVAAMIPDAKIDGLGIEVRPVVFFADSETESEFAGG
jgi:hypothetical protein